MGLLPGRKPSNAALDDRCDRCGKPAKVRVGKLIAHLHEHDGQPHAVYSREMDLYFCADDFLTHQGGLSLQGFRMIEAVT
jgi:hypothetical protein